MRAGFVRKRLRPTREVESFLSIMQEQFAEALAEGDRTGMAEVSGVLSISYAAIGSHELSCRWAHEYLDNLALLNKAAG